MQQLLKLIHRIILIKKGPVIEWKGYDCFTFWSRHFLSIHVLKMKYFSFNIIVQFSWGPFLAVLRQSLRAFDCHVLAF